MLQKYFCCIQKNQLKDKKIEYEIKTKGNYDKNIIQKKDGRSM